MRYKDGGAFSVLSELFILREVMNRLQSIFELDSTPLPCSHFDVIGGSGFGGILLALLLGRLRMSVDESIKFFILFQELYKPNLDNPERSNFLSGCLRARFPDQRMAERCPPCKTFVCAMPAKHVTGHKPVLFRNYAPRKFSSFDCKIWEAGLATTAHPSLFEPISIGPSWGLTPYVDSAAFGFGNPIELVIEETKGLFTNCTEFLFLSLGAGHPGVFSVPSDGDNWISMLRHIAEDCERLADRMEGMNQIGYFRVSVAQGLQREGAHELIEPHFIEAQTIQYIQTAIIDRQLDDAVQFLVNRERQQG
ncbi:acyl transferase/acyl hydrolase/lysophospholipase [Flagelloscypha sp. PMI_526]|nr:acyl transferase/acyl hydrolase/lysophospholipase [Flagelloscypha sp. PMI_526]